MQLGEVHLIQYRQVAWQRAHFAIYVHQSSSFTAEDRTGTLINVVGNPINGFLHEIKPDYDLAQEKLKHEVTYLTAIDLSHLDKLIKIAQAVEPPEKSEDFMGTGGWCQE